MILIIFDKINLILLNHHFLFLTESHFNCDYSFATTSSDSIWSESCAKPLSVLSTPTSVYILTQSVTQPQRAITKPWLTLIFLADSVPYISYALVRIVIPRDRMGYVLFALICCQNLTVFYRETDFY